MKSWHFNPVRLPVNVVVWTLTLVAISLWSAPRVHAGEATAPNQSAGPIHISADRLVSNSRQNHAEFSGNVKVVQNQTTITSDRLKLIYKEGDVEQSGINASSIDTIEAYGNVRIEFDNRVAVGQKAVYTTSDRKLVLTGPGAKVTSGPDVVEGSSITYYRDNGKVEIVGDVNMTIRSDQRGLN